MELNKMRLALFMVGAMVALAALCFQMAAGQHEALCSEATMPSESPLFDSLRARGNRAPDCQECCRSHGKRFDYKLEGSQMVCSCLPSKQKIDFHRKKL